MFVIVAGASGYAEWLNSHCPNDCAQVPFGCLEDLTSQCVDQNRDFAILISRGFSSGYVQTACASVRELGCDPVLIIGDSLCGSALTTLKTIADEEGWECLEWKEFKKKYLTDA